MLRDLHIVLHALWDGTKFIARLLWLPIARPFSTVFGCIAGALSIIPASIDFTFYQYDDARNKGRSVFASLIIGFFSLPVSLIVTPIILPLYWAWDGLTKGVRINAGQECFNECVLILNNPILIFSRLWEGIKFIAKIPVLLVARPVSAVIGCLVGVAFSFCMAIDLCRDQYNEARVRGKNRVSSGVIGVLAGLGGLISSLLMFPMYGLWKGLTKGFKGAIKSPNDCATYLDDLDETLYPPQVGLREPLLTPDNLIPTPAPARVPALPQTNERLQLLIQGIQQLEARQAALDESIAEMNERVTRLEERVASSDERIVRIGEEVARVEAQLPSHNEEKKGFPALGQLALDISPDKIEPMLWLTKEELEKFADINKNLPKDKQKLNKELLDRYLSYAADRCPTSLTDHVEIKIPITVETNNKHKLSIITFEGASKVDNNFQAFVASCNARGAAPFNPVTMQPLDLPGTRIYIGFSETVFKIVKDIREAITGSKCSNDSKYEDTPLHSQVVLKAPSADSKHSPAAPPAPIVDSNVPAPTSQLGMFAHTALDEVKLTHDFYKAILRNPEESYRELDLREKHKRLSSALRVRPSPSSELRAMLQSELSRVTQERDKLKAVNDSVQTPDIPIAGPSWASRNVS